MNLTESHRDLQTNSAALTTFQHRISMMDFCTKEMLLDFSLIQRVAFRECLDDQFPSNLRLVDAAMLCRNRKGDVDLVLKQEENQYIEIPK